MWCLISQPNSVVFEVRVDPKSIGQDCLEKVCEYLGISNEADYFGLKYENTKGEELWLNLRNPIDRQVNCHGHTSPLRLALRVKFWVPPHLLLQETTRHQFYLHARSDLIEKRLLANDWNGVSRVIALIAQAESDDYDSLHPPHSLYLQASTVDCVDASSRPNNLLQRIITNHKKMKGMKRSAAEYWLLKEISELESFGEEIFKKTHPNVFVGVGPHGITICEKSKEKQLISFTNIISASSHRRTFKLEYLSVDNQETSLEVKLDSSHAASSLYRAITEKHAFYSCETVRSAVTSQFIRDLKGTIVSIFNEDSTLGKKYVFDIRRTCREVYDNARRAIYQESRARLTLDNEKCGANMCERSNFKDSEERLTRFIEAMTCKICMDNKIDSVFIPCSHVVACTECAARIEKCPLCRTEISQAQKLFMPVW
ncbi:E3 ubiquitin-protein ligase MYLIP [Cylas formicarius]|uniref:E3 ubiquitin-protein ligase MYLIP n=1 Tax=Cylas formicarius TaxID=197179 RepID=UPI0029589C66|nr:E3 ubiquitin-protein ligase MYLIP [Cylas formicarius]